MGKPAAKLGDKVLGNDIHIVLVPSPAGQIPTPMPMPFSGTITDGCSNDVLIEGKPAALVGSTAANLPQHIAPVGQFQKNPDNKGTVLTGSATVLINGKPAARAGDKVNTCSDPVPLPTGTIMSTSQVLIGD